MTALGARAQALNPAGGGFGTCARAWLGSGPRIRACRAGFRCARRGPTGAGLLAAEGKVAGLDRLDENITTMTDAHDPLGTKVEEGWQLVRFLHVASPYVVQHRGRTFVVVIPGEVACDHVALQPLVEDLVLLHGLGVRLVVVLGGAPAIDAHLRSRGLCPRFEGAYRVTDGEAMAGALGAAAANFTAVAGFMSRAPAVPVARRHGPAAAATGGAPPAGAAAVQVVNGNFTVASRRGIVDGVDFGLMGQVRHVRAEAVATQLAAGAVVVLTNVGSSSSGELLNCNVYDVATHAAVELRADKLICLVGPEVAALGLPAYLPLDDAEELIAHGATGASSAKEPSFAAPSGAEQAATSGENGTGSWAGTLRGDPAAAEQGQSSRAGADRKTEELCLDLDGWQQVGYPREVVAATVACRNGVRRAHLIDAAADGAMLIELYTRDGTRGVTMIAADLYEGIRRAAARDADGVRRLLEHLNGEDGYELAPGWLRDLSAHLGAVTVLEREGRLLGVACLADLGTSPLDGVRAAELAALIVHPAYRRCGLGDSLLDWVEQDSRRLGYGRLVLIQTGRGGYDWFLERDYKALGPAVESQLLPKVCRNSLPPFAQLYSKDLQELTEETDVPAGRRIGF